MKELAPIRAKKAFGLVRVVDMKTERLAMWPLGDQFSLLRSSRGFTLVEVLVTFLLVAIGLLGLSALQTTTISDQFEALQRLQATNVLDDMASRLSANPGGVKSGAYTVNSGAVYGTQTLQTAATCSSSVSLPALDLCEWNRALIGASVLQGGVGQAAPLNARGCIEVGPNSGSGEVVIRVAVAWQGLAPSAAPSITCGSGVYGDDRYRRVLFRDMAVR